MAAYTVVIIALILVLLGLGSYWWLSPHGRRRFELPPPPALLPAPREPEPAEPAPPEPEAPVPGTRHPIVLVHGLFGFDSLGVGRLRGDYFRGVRERLERAGHRVEVVRLPPLGSVRSRAERLVEQVRRLDAARVNLVAHSMGGLDARYAITKLGLSESVASLTTVGTPHRGTPIADGSALLLAPAGRLGLLERLGAGGLLDVTTERMAAFNRDVPDSPSVEYFSYVGSIQKSGLMMWTSRRMLRTDGDGLVPADSQRWGVVMDHIAADHWAQIGWSAGFDAAELYERIADELAARGF